jgi:flagellar protein FliO/FliZ
MQWLDQLPFADNRVVQLGFLAACGIAALIVLAIVYRLAFAHRLRVPGGRTRQPRLGLVDAFSLDGQRQLVLVRRDNVEHLVMIGGPNDVLVESQINRAMTPARENNQASPLLAPSAPARRTETAVAAAPVIAEASPAKVAAPAPAAPPAAPTPAAPKAPVPTPAAPKAPALTSAAPKAPAATPAIPKAPAPAPTAAAVTPPAAAPAAKANESEPAAATRPAPAPSPVAPSGEPARPAPAASPPPRPALSRPAMPPPIIPSSGSGNRATVTRLTEKVPPRASQIPGNPPTPSPAAPAPPHSEKAEPAATAPTAAPRPTPPAATDAAPSAASTQARPAAKTQPSAASDGAPKLGEGRPPDDKANAASTVKPSAKVDDPFADLDSLEAEMARLLGREKLS